MNAHRSGVDLVGALIDVARTDDCGTGVSGTGVSSTDGGGTGAGGTGASRVPRIRVRDNGWPGVQTHQLLLAVPGAAQHGGRRRDVTGELLAAMSRRGSYRASTEELRPAARDPLAVLPVAVAALATLIQPGTWRHFVAGSVDAYSLTQAAWDQIAGRADRCGTAVS